MAAWTSQRDYRCRLPLRVLAGTKRRVRAGGVPVLIPFQLIGGAYSGWVRAAEPTRSDWLRQANDRCRRPGQAKRSDELDENCKRYVGD